MDRVRSLPGGHLAVAGADGSVGCGGWSGLGVEARAELPSMETFINPTNFVSLLCVA